MIDAYTIGVTLALDDGVSAGLATIRAELVDVLAATEQATAALAALRAMAGEVTGIAPALPRTRPAAVPVSPGQDNQSVAAPAFETVSPTQAEPAPRTSFASTAPAAEPPPIASTPNVALPGKGDTMRSPVASAPVAPPPQPTTETAPKTADAQRTLPEPAASVAPTPAVMPAITAAFAPVSIAAPEQTTPAVPASVRIDATLTTSPRLQPARAPASPAERHRGARHASQAERHRSATAPRDEPEVLRGTGRRATEQSAERAPRESRDESRDMPREGTLHLDGTVLGAWIEDYLTHRLSGPRHAGTGFDARMTPAWPGMALE